MTKHLRSTVAAFAATGLVLAGCATDDDPVEQDTIVEDSTDGDEADEDGEVESDVGDVEEEVEEELEEEDTDS